MAKQTPQKKAQSVRQQAVQGSKVPKTHRIRQTASIAAKPFKHAARVGKKEYYLPMPKNKVGGFLNKRRYVIPRYFRESWQELKKVTWPNAKQTAKLTLAVFVFAFVFGLLITLTDYGLDKLFRKVLLK